MAAKHFVALAVCEEKWEEAVSEGKRFVETRNDAIHTLLPFMSEVEQMLYLKKESTWAYALPLVQRQPRNRRVVDATAEWTLNSKGLAIEMLTERVRLARGEAGPQAQQLMNELNTIRGRLSRRTFAGTFLGADATEVASLVEKESQLSKRLAALVGRDRLQPRWVSLDEVRKSLRADEALLEFVACKDRDFRTDKETPERYFAWVIRPNLVEFVDLGPCEPIDAKIGRVRLQMETTVGLSIANRGVRAVVEECDALLLDLSADVFHPLEKHLTGVRSLVVGPSEGLWLAPWAALRTSKEKYVIEDFNVRTVITGRHLVRDNGTGAKLQAVGPPVLFGNPDFGITLAQADGVRGNAYLESAHQRGVPLRSRKLAGVAWTPLPGTLREIESIRTNVERQAGQSALVFVGENATEAAMKKISRPKTLVIPTHGFFLPAPDETPVRSAPRKITESESYLDIFAPQGAKIESLGETLDDGRIRVTGMAPGSTVRRTVRVTFATGEVESKEVDMIAGQYHRWFVRASERISLAAHFENPLLRCGLVFAGANRRPAGDDPNDGIWTGLEIVGMDLEGTELVVLSACETANQDMRAGESVAGLRQAFQLAGAKAVAATLWKIPDAETVALSSRFWEDFAGSSDAASSLAIAQRQAIQDRTVARCHPYYWAAFVVTTR